MRQVHRQKEKAKKEQRIESNGIVRTIISSNNAATFRSRFLKTILSIHDSYYIFLGTTIQLNDVGKMCCDSTSVLCIDIILNLCSSWVTDCYYGQ